MFPTNAYITNEALNGSASANKTVQLASEAGHLFNEVLFQGWLDKMRSILRGGPRRLYDLNEVEAASQVRGRHYAGIKTVAIHKIVGSEGRSEDFDAEFRPLRIHVRNRWQRVAQAALTGKELPPVELIQIGDRYFVRDGHHRISVARNLGQESIDAEVTVWQVCDPLPWEAEMSCPPLAVQAA